MGHIFGHGKQDLKVARGMSRPGPRPSSSCKRSGTPSSTLIVFMQEEGGGGVERERGEEETRGGEGRKRGEGEKGGKEGCLLISSCDAIKGKGDDTVKEEGKETEGEEERGEERKKVVHMKKNGERGREGKKQIYIDSLIDR